MLLFNLSTFISISTTIRQGKAAKGKVERLREFKTKTYDIPLSKNEILPDEQLQLEEEAHLEVDRNVFSLLSQIGSSFQFVLFKYLETGLEPLSSCFHEFTDVDDDGDDDDFDDVDDVDDDVRSKRRPGGIFSPENGSEQKKLKMERSC